MGIPGGTRYYFELFAEASGLTHSHFFFENYWRYFMLLFWIGIPGGTFRWSVQTNPLTRYFFEWEFLGVLFAEASKPTNIHITFLNGNWWRNFSLKRPDWLYIWSCHCDISVMGFLKVTRYFLEWEFLEEHVTIWLRIGLEVFHVTFLNWNSWRYFSLKRPDQPTHMLFFWNGNSWKYFTRYFFEWEFLEVLFAEASKPTNIHITFLNGNWWRNFLLKRPDQHTHTLFFWNGNSWKYFTRYFLKWEFLEVFHATTH